VEIDPVVAALAGAIVTMAGLFYRHLLQQLHDLESKVVFWRDRYLDALAKAEIGAEHAAATKDRDELA
jgi:hypothetical protein